MIIIIILYIFISCHTTCVLFHWSPALIILYHAYARLDVAYYLSACSCMPVLMTRFSMHDFDSNLSICIRLSLHATWHSPFREFLTLLDPHVQIPEFGLWILLVADQS